MRIGQHQARLIEGADHVLAKRVIDACLAPHRGIDLGKQRSRHLNIGDTALVGGGSEAGEITNDSASQRYDGRRAFAAIVQKRVINQV